MATNVIAEYIKIKNKKVEKNQISLNTVPNILIWIVVGIIVAITIVNPPVNDKIDQEDFVRTITGLECHLLEQYVLDLEYKWDKGHIDTHL